MSDQTLAQSGLGRSAVYSYLRPVIDGRRVLEVGCGTGDATAYLVRLGAKSVIGAGSSHEIAEARGRHHEGAVGFATINAGAIGAAGVFDLVLVPDATEMLRGHGPMKLSALLALVAPGGRLACVVANGDRGDGIPYYDVVDALAPHFSKVRMFGQTPFSAYGLAEFDEAAADLRVESDLADAESEEPTHYIALAGPDDATALGYALVQIPISISEGVGPSDRAASIGGIKAPETALGELRTKLVEAEGKAEGLLRVSRAQSEEIEELRARLRRTGEARAELDEEVRRLRHALLEADESVVNLTRRTTEEMTALAQRLTAGLRAGDATPGPVASEELRRRESELAERESALSERDDRIAALEAAKQEAVWRADAAEDELERLRADLLSLRGEYERLSADASHAQELQESLKAQEATVEEFRRAALAHLDEVNRLRDAGNEQASLVAELEDELRATEIRLTAATAECTQLRQGLAELEDADRGRRSRLAELEGLMLRAEREATAVRETREREIADLAELRRQLKAAEGDARRAQQAETELEELRRRFEVVEGEAKRVQEAEANLEDLRQRLNAAESDRERAQQAKVELEEVRQRLKAAESEQQRAQEAEASLAAALDNQKTSQAKLSELEQRLRDLQERDQRLAELRAEAPDPEEVYERLFDLETQYQAATMAAARVPNLEAKLAELESRLQNR